MPGVEYWAWRAGTSGFVVVAMLVSLVAAASATTYVPISDDALYEQAEVIAELVILGRLPAVAGRPPTTEYHAIVDNVIKGDLESSSIVVASPGGEAGDGRELVVVGAPRFDRGERVLAFLQRDPSGSYGFVHLGLGVFSKVGGGRRALAVRRAGGARLVDLGLEPTLELVRSYPRFVRWLERRAEGRRSAGDYRHARARTFAAPYRLVEIAGKNVRWFEFDIDKSVNWSIRNTESSDSQIYFVDALNVWSRAPVSLRLVSGTSSTAGLLRNDNVNAIIFGDPNGTVPGTFICPDGGLVAISGFWFSDAGGQYMGRQFRRIQEADIVINDGADCILNNNPRSSAELFTRQLGFSLGINFSNVASATMSPAMHNDGRGAFLTPDDIAALEYLYGTGTSSDPEEPDPEPEPDRVQAPSNLKVTTPKARVVRLRWKDNSKDETRFEIWRRIGGKKWKLWQTKPANTRSMKSGDARPSVTYTFRVRAQKGNLYSEFSNEVTVTMPSGKLAPPEKLAVETTSATTGFLTWEDRTKGEKLFQIERRESDGEWSLWSTAEANATSQGFDDGIAGATYSFRIRAKKGSKVSDWSNEAMVTMPSS